MAFNSLSLAFSLCSFVSCRGVRNLSIFKEIVVNKFMSESKQFISEKKAVKFVEMVENMESYSPIELLSVLF